MYVLSYYIGFHRATDLQIASKAVPVLSFCISDDCRLYHHHSLFRDGRLVARQASYQGV